MSASRNGSLKVIVLAAVLASLLLPAQKAEAVWHQLLIERFESPPASWPWGQWLNDTAQPRWGVEANAIFHSGAPGHVQSIWCAGTPDGLQPGVDSYLPNRQTIIAWGPFDLSTAVGGGGFFWLNAEMESNASGSGDDVWLGILQRTGTPPATWSFWDHLYQLRIGETDGWQQKPYQFDVAIEPGIVPDTTSYLGLDNVWVSFYFRSDNDNNVGRGAFVDDFYLGYDDGIFDFEMNTIVAVDSADTTHFLEDLYQDEPARFGVRFEAHSDSLSRVVSHILYVDSVGVDTVTGQWQGGIYGEDYLLIFDQVFTAQELDSLDVRVVLDADSQQTEYSEENNELSRFYHVVETNRPPTLEWIQPSQEGTSAHDDMVQIIIDTYNAPANEPYYLSLYYDSDSTGLDGTRIMGFNALPMSNGLDTLYWNVSNIEPGSYNLYTKLQDLQFDAEYSYAPGPVHVGVSVEEQEPGSLPGSFEIVSAYPNPFNPTVELQVNLPEAGELEAHWFSVEGRQVDMQKYGELAAGRHRLSWTPQGLPTGSYFVRLSSPSGTALTRVIYLK